MSDEIQKAAVKFVRAAKFVRLQDIRMHNKSKDATTYEHLSILADYHRSLADLATAELDLILAVGEEV